MREYSHSRRGLVAAGAGRRARPLAVAGLVALLGGAGCEGRHALVQPCPAFFAITISPATLTTVVGQRGRATGIVTAVCIPDRRLTWRTADTAVATVVQSYDSADVAVAVVLGRAAGTTTLIATAVQDPTKSAAAIVTVATLVGTASPGPSSRR